MVDLLQGQEIVSDTTPLWMGTLQLMKMVVHHGSIWIHPQSDKAATSRREDMDEESDYESDSESSLS